ncbi:MAG TPA: DUF2161 family putative PD-(D/E)XK-type phosphodiesterase [Symbiobacteriaceae bacterium]|nr:DUF2161 family putative PD-(D/E)XK-type phosphodiesterase [Symbiobacteriaceae bacterium]
MSGRKEADLYAPVKRFLEELGFDVKGEVNGCDLAAVRGDDLVLVELKVAFNLPLLLQGVERQRLSDTVYLAVEVPASRRAAPRWAEIQRLCRRLDLGLLTVSFAAHREPRVEVICEPGPYQPRRAVKERVSLLREFHKRTGDHNVGGVTRRPIVTAYRESALLVADHIRRYGSAKPSEIKAATGCERAAAILQQNVYGWFEREQPGLYRVTPDGEKALETYADVLPHKDGPGA